MDSKRCAGRLEVVVHVDPDRDASRSPHLREHPGKLLEQVLHGLIPQQLGDALPDQEKAFRAQRGRSGVQKAPQLLNAVHEYLQLSEPPCNFVQELSFLPRQMMTMQGIDLRQQLLQSSGELARAQDVFQDRHADGQ